MSVLPVKSDWRQWLRPTFLSLAGILGALDAWHTRHTVSPDGISYLDMGDAYMRGDWYMAVNALWSPFYSWLLGLAMLTLKPSPYWEVAAVHLVNFLIYLSALWCFDFLLRELVRHHHVPEGGDAKDGRVALPVWAWMALGYPLFIWTSLRLITVAAVTPDMCVAAFLFLAAGMLLRVRRGDAGRVTFGILGIVLGFSYLAKAAMLPVAFVFLSVSLFSGGLLRKKVPRVLLALGIFLLVGSLYFVPLSIKKGWLSFGDGGLLNYAWYVNKVSLHVHWQGEDSSSGIPKHPTRKIHDAPAVYEFREPIKGTYPPWYDPSYWYEGVVAHFDLESQVKMFKKNLGVLRLIFSTREQKIWGIGFLILYLFTHRRWSHLLNISTQWYLLLPPLAALFMFSLVHVEARYTGAFIALLWLGMFSGVRLPERARWRLVASCLLVTLTLVMLRSFIPPAIVAAQATFRCLREGEDESAYVQWQVADHLTRMGLRPGDEVATVGYAFDALWARLARVRIISEITSGSIESPTHDVEKFWAAETQTRARIIELFVRAGAKAIIAHKVSDSALAEDWQRLGDTDYYVHIINREDAADDKLGFPEGLSSSMLLTTR